MEGIRCKRRHGTTSRRFWTSQRNHEEVSEGIPRSANTLKLQTCHELTKLRHFILILYLFFRTLSFYGTNVLWHLNLYHVMYLSFHLISVLLPELPEC